VKGKVVVVDCEIDVFGLVAHFGSPAVGVGAPKGERPSSPNGRDPAQEAWRRAEEGPVRGRVGSEAAPDNERGRPFLDQPTPTASQPPPASADTSVRWDFPCPVIWQ